MCARALPATLARLGLVVRLPDGYRAAHPFGAAPCLRPSPRDRRCPTFSQWTIAAQDSCTDKTEGRRTGAIRTLCATSIACMGLNNKWQQGANLVDRKVREAFNRNDISSLLGQYGGEDAPEIASRADFRVGTRVSFTDQNLQHRVGLIVRINQRTATLDCDGQTWRVGFGLLRPLFDI